jgi:phosphoglycerate dehydrogenase-like enzyme
MSAGAEGFFVSKIKDMKDVILTCTKGIHGAPMSDQLIAFVFSWLRNMPALIRNQTAGLWHKPQVETLDESEGKTLGIVGLGSIGSVFAKKFKTLGFKVVSYKRTPGENLYVDELYTGNELNRVLNQSDFVVLVTPLTPLTKHIISEKEFKAMKKSAVLINMGRGQLVNTEALVSALCSGQIAGACLDVVDPEPLPEDHPLWYMPNVIITPHCSPNSPIQMERCLTQFCQNLKNFIEGLPMFNVLTKEKDY